jgi:O-antigen/teichoic acid export membrane protein
MRMIKWLDIKPNRMRQFWYAPVLVAATAMMLLRTLLMAKILPVTEFADFNGGLLISSAFVMFGGLGLYFLLQREMPMRLVRGQERMAALLLIQSLLVAICCFAVVVVPIAFGIPELMFGPQIMAFGVFNGLSQQLFLIATTESRSRGLPLLFANQSMGRAVLALAASTGVAIWTQSAAAAIAAEGIVTILLVHAVLIGARKRARIGIRPLIYLAAIRLRDIEWRAAFVLLIASFASYFLLNADRWVAATVLASESFAQYSFAWLMLMVSQALQAVANASVFPALARRFARDGRAASFRLAAILSAGTLLAGAVVGWPTVRLLNFVISKWFPAYESVYAILAVFYVVAVLRVSDFWSSYLIVIGSEVRLLVTSLVAGILGMSIWFTVLVPDPGQKADVTTVATLALVLAVLGYGGIFANGLALRK